MQRVVSHLSRSRMRKKPCSRQCVPCMPCFFITSIVSPFYVVCQDEEKKSEDLVDPYLTFSFCGKKVRMYYHSLSKNTSHTFSGLCAFLRQTTIYDLLIQRFVCVSSLQEQTTTHYHEDCPEFKEALHLPIMVGFLPTFPK